MRLVAFPESFRVSDVTRGDFYCSRAFEDVSDRGGGMRMIRWSVWRGWWTQCRGRKRS